MPKPQSLLLILLLAGPAAGTGWAAAAKPCPKEETGQTAGGRVVDEQGRPVPDARIQAHFIGWNPSDAVTPETLCSEAKLMPSAQTDARGRFTLKSFVPGWFQVSVSARGFLPYELKRVELGGAHGSKGLDIVLQKGVSLSGQLRTAAGAPAGGAYLSLTCPGRFMDLSTDPDGRYRFEGLRPGVACEVWASGRRLGGVRKTLEIRPGENHLDLRLDPSELVRVHGRVTTPEGTPIEGAGIDTSTFDGTPVQTGADGAFEALVWREEGGCEISARKPGYAASPPLKIRFGEAPPPDLTIRLEKAITLTGRLLHLDPGQLGQAWVSVNLRDPADLGRTVSPDGTYRIEGLAPGEWTVEAHAGSRVAKGRVTLRPGETGAVLDLDFPARFLVRGRVLEPDGEGIAGANVYFESAIDQPILSVLSREDGAFEIPLENGSYKVFVRGPQDARKGYRPRTLPRPVVVADAPIDGIELHLEKGQILRGCVLGLLPQEHFSISASDPPFGLDPRVTPDGCYRFDAIGPGDWSITARVQDVYPDGETREIQDRVTVASGDPETVHDLNFGFGDRTLTIRPAGVPAIGLGLKLVFADGGGRRLVLFQRLGEDGAFHLGRLREGTCRLQLTDFAGRMLADRPVEITSDQEVTIDLRQP